MLQSQDIHYSQFYNSPLNVNPANTGIFNGDKRVNLSYRSQWRSVPVPWTTFSGSFDRKFYPKKDTKSFFSAGLLFNYDVQGNVTDLNLTNIDITGSYTFGIDENNLFTVGGLLGYATRGFDGKSLTWDRQWDGNTFNPNAPSGEAVDADRVSFLETGLGVNYRWQKSSRTKLDLGIGMFHVQEPKTALYDNGDVSLPRRITLSGVGSFEVAPKLDLQVNVLSQFQGDYDELVMGGLAKIHLNQARGKELELHLGGGYRTSGSVFPLLAIQYKNFYGGVNYDINVSDFNNDPVSIKKPTSFELHFNYIITDVKPFRKQKVCPIF